MECFIPRCGWWVIYCPQHSIKGGGDTKRTNRGTRQTSGELSWWGFNKSFSARESHTHTLLQPPNKPPQKSGFVLRHRRNKTTHNQQCWDLPNNLLSSLSSQQIRVASARILSVVHPLCRIVDMPLVARRKYTISKCDKFISLFFLSFLH